MTQVLFQGLFGLHGFQTVVQIRKQYGIFNPFRTFRNAIDRIKHLGLLFIEFLLLFGVEPGKTEEDYPDNQ